jgi:hypothetical protein
LDVTVVTTHDRISAIGLAAQEGWHRCLALLLNHTVSGSGSGSNGRGDKGGVSGACAERSGAQDSEQTDRVDAGIDVNVPDKDGDYPVYSACLYVAMTMNSERYTSILSASIEGGGRGGRGGGNGAAVSSSGLRKGRLVRRSGSGVEERQGSRRRKGRLARRKTSGSDEEGGRVSSMPSPWQDTNNGDDDGDGDSHNDDGGGHNDGGVGGVVDDGRDRYADPSMDSSRGLVLLLQSGRVSPAALRQAIRDLRYFMPTERRQMEAEVGGEPLSEWNQAR